MGAREEIKMNNVNPARHASVLPELFIKMLTDENDHLVGPFAGSNVTGEICERLKRRWIAVDIVEEYLEGSKFRFSEFFVNEPGVRAGHLSTTVPSKLSKQALRDG